MSFLKYGKYGNMKNFWKIDFQIPEYVKISRSNNDQFKNVLNNLNWAVNDYMIQRQNSNLEAIFVCKAKEILFLKICPKTSSFSVLG